MHLFGFKWEEIERRLSGDLPLKKPRDHLVTRWLIMLARSKKFSNSCAIKNDIQDNVLLLDLLNTQTCLHTNYLSSRSLLSIYPYKYVENIDSLHLQGLIHSWRGSLSLPSLLSLFRSVFLNICSSCSSLYSCYGFLSLCLLSLLNTSLCVDMCMHVFISCLFGEKNMNEWRIKTISKLK
jgi:hypothetical protein